MNIELKEHERLDDLQNGYHIIQNTENFCFGMDAVLLADFAKVKPGEKALDMVENMYPEIRIWRLVTPTQVLRNSVFYINKCGYSIVRVDERDKEKECGMFVFEKKCGGNEND